MFDISWSELLIILIVAIVFIGPKELPMVMYNLARGIGKLRRSAEEFRQQFLEQMRQNGYEDLQKEMQALRGLNPVNQIRDNFEDLVRKAGTSPQTPPVSADAPPAAPPVAAAPAETAAPAEGVQAAVTPQPAANGEAAAPVVALQPAQAAMAALPDVPAPGANENKRPAAL
jgi:sec-independent protein translocase protein TatB